MSMSNQLSFPVNRFNHYLNPLLHYVYFKEVLLFLNLSRALSVALVSTGKSLLSSSNQPCNWEYSNNSIKCLTSKSVKLNFTHLFVFFPLLVEACSLS